MSYKALMIGLILLFMLGGFFPLMVQDFAPEVQEISGFYSWIYNFVDNGITLPSFFFNRDGFNINPFNLFGGNFKEFILSQIQGFALIPQILGIPLITLTALLIIYGLIKMILP